MCHTDSYTKYQQEVLLRCLCLVEVSLHAFIFTLIDPACSFLLQRRTSVCRASSSARENRNVSLLTCAATARTTVAMEKMRQTVVSLSDSLSRHKSSVLLDGEAYEYIPHFLSLCRVVII